MSYIGSSAAPQFLSFSGVRSQSFNGNGSTTAFSLNRPVENTVAIEVLVNNVQQSPFDSSYSVSGSTLTFSEAPSSGTGNVYVIFRDAPLGSLNPLDGSVTTAKLANAAVTAEKLAAGAAVPSQTGQAGKFLKTDGTDATWETVPTPTPAAVSDQANSSTGYFDLPSGTTAQRPASPGAGMVRFNTTTGEPEWYDTVTSSWIPFGERNYNVEYLVVAGGGAGGMGSTHGAAGGGAGGYRSSVQGESSGGGASAESPLFLLRGTSYTVTVGAGGSGTSTGATNGGNGNNSVFGTITSIGGGGGQGYVSTSGGTAPSGGCGGGGAAQNGLGGAGTTGQGYAGGNGNGGSTNYPGGGGGGAGGIGQISPTANTGKAGAGGVGVQSNIDGNNYYYAGGGGGGGYVSGNGGGNGGLGGGGGGSTQTGAGGLGGGSARNSGAAGPTGTSGANGGAGGANTGGGAGAGDTTHTGPTGNGGSGIVIIRYPGSQRGSGGTVTSSGGYTIHTFTSSGTYTA